LCMLSLRASCFFARAEKLFGSEVSGMLGSAKLQAVSELLFVISSASLLLLSLLWVFILLLVCAGAAALGVVRFCAWTDAEIAFFSASGLLRSFDGPSRRFSAGFFVLLIESSLRFLMTAKDGSATIIQGLWEAGCLKVLVVVAAAVQATTTGYHSESKRDRRVVFRVSFVSILLIALTGVAGSLGGVSWLRFGAVGLLLLVEEHRRSSAATKATPPAQLGLLEASSCHSFASSCSLDARSIKVNDWFEAKSANCVSTGAPVFRKLFCNVWCVAFALALLMHTCFSSEMEEGCVQVWLYLQSRPFLATLELLVLMILVVVFIALAVATAYALCQAAVLELSYLGIAAQSLGRACKGKFLAALGKKEIESGESVPESCLSLPRVQFLSDESLLFSYQFVKLRAEMSAQEFSERYDGRYVSREFMVNKRQEVAWERMFEVFASDDVFDADWYYLLHGLVPAFTDETFFVDEKGEKCHPAHWTAFSTDVVPFLKELGVVPPGFASWDVYESYLRSYHEFYQICIKWYDHHFCGMAVEPLIVDDVGEDGENTNNQPEDSMDLMESASYSSAADAERDGCIGASWCLLSLNYLPVIEEEGEEGAEMEEEECSFIAPAEDAGNLVATVDDEEEPGVGVEVEVEPHAAVVLPRPMRKTRKLKTFGPCNRTRPYLKRKCKENVRYTK
ncbi:MAG: hypothetical protein ACRCT2_12845, partial [Plesiomonas shigelloides]